MDSSSDHNQSPKVSVVIPTYNRAKDLARCLDSLVSQTFTDFEVLVCDDGSTDNTHEVVQRYMDVLQLRYHLGENFGGPARPRNTGLKMSKGEYVAFLDSDDWWMPEKLQVSIDALEEGEDLVYHDLYLVFDENQRSFRERTSFTRELHCPVCNDLIINCNAIPNSSVVVRKSLLLQIGGMSEDPGLISVEDYDAWLRIAKLTNRFKYIPEALGYYWRGGGNIFSAEKSFRPLSRLRERHMEAFSRPDILEKMWWYDYGIGRRFYKKGAYAQSSEHLNRIRLRRVPARIAAKTLVTLGMIRIGMIINRLRHGRIDEASD